ncbi:S-M checkpoint control protein rad4 [Cyberlindnera fabianii]|uniref:S-M checkpoint control protein rad4 n=1 Tax=Cyberlindnera fabianii TaxID=36022 RepID=A0A1V2L8J3_CYBFA|nr:S-M checkpoint control protein rad4 [Cyberlindnera fabianii]
MPTFDGFKICLSRINTDDQFDAADKFELVKFIQENGVEDQSKIGESSCLVWDDLRKRKRKRIITEEEEQIKKKPEIWKSIMDEAKKQASLPKKHDDAWDEPTIPNDIEKENINTFKIEFFNQTKTNTLIKTIKSHSGIIIANDTDLLLDPPSYIIVPSDFPTTDLPSFFFELATTEVLTEFFIERCLHYRQIRLDTWGKPFYQPLINAPNLDVCITGFQGIELLHITKMLQLTPFKLHDYLTDERDLLIINYDILRSKTVSQASKVSTKRKLDFSRKNHIPILTIVFLFDSFYNGFVFNINGRDLLYPLSQTGRSQTSLKRAHIKRLRERQTSIQDKNSPSSFPHSSPNSSSSSSSLPKLPSPVRNKRNDKWGRLVGRAPVSQLGKIELGPSLDKSPDVEDESFQSTQIGYGENLGDKLKSLLSGRDESIQDKGVTSEKRKRSTRQGYKEMMNILDNE